MKGRWILLFVFIILAMFFVFRNKGNITGMFIDETGNIIEQNNSFSVYKIIFKGADGKDIYGMFFTPLKNEFDVVIVLPAAAGTKESRRFYGELLAEMGYGALILDQRGIGETDGRVNSLQEDFYAFFKKGNVHQFLMADDAVKAADFLDKIRGVRGIGILGESMGGRNAIIAAGLDEKIKTAIVISSAGYKGSFGSKEADEFIAYINPDSYIGKISPRRLLMLHAINDSVISIDDARYTFSLAGEPKKFVEFNETECKHGYCNPMLEYIERELKKAFE